MPSYQWADAHISSAHRDDGGKIHGHTWKIRAFWEDDGKDVLPKQKLLKKWAQSLDHRELPQHLITAESLAGHFAVSVHAVEVHVWREPEGLGAIFKK
jgi:hypothetical protein